MSTSITVEVISIALHFLTCTMFLCGVVVWMLRNENHKQRTYLSVTMIIGAMLMMLRLLTTYQKGIPSMGYSVLPINNLYGGFWALLILFFYPVEVVNPGWFRWKTILLVFIPMIIISLILVSTQIEFRKLHSFHNILEHINEINVWLWILLLFIFIIPYTILLLCVPYNWKQSRVDTKWIRWYVIGIQGIAILYILFMLTGSLFIRAIHLIYCTLLFAYITYQELFLRLFPEVTPTESNTIVVFSLTNPVIEKKESIVENELRERLEVYMQHEEPWRSPDITINDVAKAIGSNRTTLSAEINSKGNETFQDIIARYRVNAFCNIAKRGEVDNVNETFFAVGFHSRAAAYERFKGQIGMTPTEYIKTIKDNNI